MLQNYRTYLNDRYANSERKSPFEIYIENTDEKQQTANGIAPVIKEFIQVFPGKSIQMLDIGCGNGELTTNLFSSIPTNGKHLNITELDVSPDMLATSKGKWAAMTHSDISVSFVNSAWEDTKYSEQFDLILASNIFIHREKYLDWVGKIFQSLKPGGMIIFVSKTKDQAYDFKMKYKPLLEGPSFHIPQIIDEIDAYISELNLSGITTKGIRMPMTLTFPHNNQSDFDGVIDFLLSKHPKDMPDSILQQINEEIKASDNTFKGEVGITIAQKIGSN